ncbi:MAG: hypothetical protein K2Q10_13170, partial [Rhodospirillales bacterium]|nr:hypothetical protein [Rhodospirillales bacterium]
LQEPVRMVISYVQLLQRRYAGRLAPEADEFIGYAVEGGQRMRTLLADIQQYVSLEAGPPEEVDCNHVLRQAMIQLDPSLKAAGAVVEADALPMVRGHGRQLALVFLNLLDNAVKYRRPDQQPRIRISANRLRDEWRFVVEDNGLGVPAEYAEIVFSLFKRLHSRAAITGNGMGLAVCRKIVGMHGGRIWLEPRAGMGATFVFILPVR